MGYADIGRARVRIMNIDALNAQQRHRYGDPFWTDYRVGNRGNPSTIGAGEGLTPTAQTELNTLAFLGSQRVKTDARVAKAAGDISDPQQKTGFFIGLQTATGSSIPGGGQDRIRNLLAPDAGGTIASLTGFDIGQQLAFSITNQTKQGVQAAPPTPITQAVIAAKQTFSKPLVLGLLGAGVLGYFVLRKKG
jgi:hypothetical protein